MFLAFIKYACCPPDDVWILILIIVGYLFMLMWWMLFSCLDWHVWVPILWHCWPVSCQSITSHLRSSSTVGQLSLPSDLLTTGECLQSSALAPWLQPGLFPMSRHWLVTHTLKRWSYWWPSASCLPASLINDQNHNKSDTTRLYNSIGLIALTLRVIASVWNRI